MAIKRVWMPSPNYSSRGAGVRLIVLHNSEGAQTYQSLGNFFASSSAGVSSHVGIDDTRGTIGEYVKRENKAWTAANANPVAVQAEFCTPSGASANWTSDTWINKHNNMLMNAADWIKEEAAKFNIPIVALTASQAQGGGRGICQHNDLGAWGGGHYDCGKGFPMSYLIGLCKGGSPAKPQPPKDTRPEDVNEMFYLMFNAAGDAAVVVPNYYADGKARIRMGSQSKSELRVNLPGSPTAKITVGPDGSDGAAIPKDCKYLIVRRDTGKDPIAATFSK